jgi:hypothetical protein
MENSTVKQDAVRAKAQQLRGCCGGDALTLCLEGLDLIRERASSLDVNNKWLVVEAVAEVMRMRVEEVSGRLDEPIWMPVPSAEREAFEPQRVYLAGTVPRRTLPSAAAAPVAPSHCVPSTAPTPLPPAGENP